MKRIHAILLGLLPTSLTLQAGPPKLIEQVCSGCHNQKTAMGGLDLSSLPFNLAESPNRERWIRTHDRIEKGEMPPKGVDLPPAQRAAMLKQLSTALHE